MSRHLAVVAAFLMAPAVLAQSQPFVVTSGEAAGKIVQGGIAGGIVPGQLPTRDNAQPAKPGTATLRGRAIASDTGRPLPRAQVRITSIGPTTPGQPPENRLATTDSNGRYEFKGVRGGRYYLTVSKPGGYMNVQYGQQRPQDPGKPLEVLDGQTIEKIDFSLPRGAVITGRIFDEAGEPVTDAQVAALRPQNIGGVRRLLPAGRTVTTNDIGEFRLFALPAGDYFISATLRNNDFGPVESDSRTGYAPTYYPGTPDIGSAQRLTVALGQTINDLSVPLSPTRTARVTGVALDSLGQPMRGMVSVSARNDILAFSAGGAGQIRPDGSFTINSLAPGDYSLQVQTQGAPGSQVELEYASADITVSGADLAGVRLTAVKASTVAGRLVIGSGDPASLRTTTVRIGVQPMPNGGVIVFGPASPPVSVNDDWTFQAKARPGQSRISTQGLTPPWRVKAVRYHGSDVTDSGFEVRPGENISDLEVELTTRVTDVSGLVTNGRGDPVKDGWIVLFPRDPAKRRPPTRYVRTARADKDGRFREVGLPAGEYLAFALETFEPLGDTPEPDLLDRFETRATRFTVGEGETKTVDLKVSTLP